MTNPRRSFLKNGFMTAASVLTANTVAQAGTFLREKTNEKITVAEGDIILFQGDSITDHGRKREDTAPNSLEGMGHGYATLAASELLRRFSTKHLTIYNRGISGNKVPQLSARWETDCLQLKPTIVSILIGVNDYWHKRNGQYEGSAESYGEQLRDLLDRTRSVLPDVKFLLGEPFAVRNVKHVDDSWFPDFTAYQKIAKEVASQSNAIFIPYQKFFDTALKEAPGDYWTSDGVHTSLAGINLMAHHWLQHIR